MPSSQVLQAIAVTAELCGRTFSEAAAMVFASDLEGYEDQAILKALQRCRKEFKGNLTVSDVTSRIDDGRPGPEQAWAMIPRGEDATVVWTQEMAAAWGVALPLLKAGEDIPARMAFKEAYIREVANARDNRQPVRWTASLGDDKAGREAPLLEAAEKGRLPMSHVQQLMPPGASDMTILRLANMAAQRALIAA
jgi:hypothetical protein